MQELAVSISASFSGLCTLVGVGFGVLFLVGLLCVFCGKKDRIGSLLIAFFFMEVALAFLFLTYGIEEMDGMESSSKLMPTLWSVPLLVSGLWQFIKVWRSSEVKDSGYGRLDKVFLVLVVLFLTVSLFNTLGFFVSTGAMLVLIMLILGERRFVLIAGTAAVWMLFTWLVFNKALLLGLPTGSLFM
ncbi:MAG: tripartite tricarboxylate transporter TctB family protein [Pyramidobacter sp.]|nr:tripartite tricarboxylate transporter TctB family protein [Pyramidobacter sp.]